MPELPEVRVIADVLQRRLAGWELTALAVNERSRHFETGLPGQEHLHYPLVLQQVWSRGKKVIFTLYHTDKPVTTENRLHLLSSLGMEGHWQFIRGQHSGLILSFHKEGSEETLYFDDVRHFGTLIVCLGDAALIDKLSDVGPDWLTCSISLEDFTTVLQRKTVAKLSVGLFLVEQQYFSGVGNYARAEILYRAKISPHRLVNSLTLEETERVWRECRALLQESYEVGGYTLASYLNPLGERGRFQPQVYGRKLDPLGNLVRSEKDKRGRMLHWVPAVQL